MFNNPWFKLATVSLAGIVITFGILWGINRFNGANANSSMNMGYSNQMSSMQMGQQGNMTGMQTGQLGNMTGMQMGQQGNMAGMNTQNGINVRESVNVGNGIQVQESVNVGNGIHVQESVNINPGAMSGMNSNGRMQFGINMMRQMRGNAGMR